VFEAISPFQGLIASNTVRERDWHHREMSCAAARQRAGERRCGSDTNTTPMLNIAMPRNAHTRLEPVNGNEPVGVLVGVPCG
jgi:hypothetical protein